MKHLGSEVGVQPIHVVGYSTGATLALNYALDALDGESSPAPASLVLVSPAVGVHRAAALAPWKDALAVVPGLQKLAWLSILTEFDPYKYNSFATNAGTQVYRLTRSVSARIAARAGSGPILDFPPTLALKSTVDATVTTDAVVHNLLEHLAPHRHELVLFDINRFALKSTLLVSDPGPLTERLMRDETLPFAIDFVTNESRESRAVVARRKPPFSGEVSEVVPLGLAWPTGVISLSHVALPFPPEDPLYGQRAPGNEDAFFLGQMAIQGELGLFVLSSDWLLRLRHNPFYDYLEARVLEWTDGVGRD